MADDSEVVNSQVWRPITTAPKDGPIPLNDSQELIIRNWAADDRLWTTQETVAFNLRTFARSILAACQPLPSAPEALKEPK